MSKRISYSQIRLWQECPQKWKYQYKDGLRERVRSGALFLGSAIDAALNELLTTKSLINAQNAFLNTLTTGEINKVIIDIKTSPRVVYGERDMDWELLTDDDINDIKTYCKEEHHESLKTHFNGIRAMKKDKGWQNLHESTQTFYNVCNWHSLKRKGLLMLGAYNNEVMPHIKEVIAVQKEVLLHNGENELIGYIDLVCRWDNGELILADNKTSGSLYEEDSVRTSEQLTIYDEKLRQEGIIPDKQAYIVMLKNIIKDRVRVCSSCKHEAEKTSRVKTCAQEINGKRCGAEFTEVMIPKAEIQIVMDQIPERTKDIILENVDAVNHMMQNNYITRNFNSCQAAYGKCPFYDLCFKNDDSGLDRK